MSGEWGRGKLSVWSSARQERFREKNPSAPSTPLSSGQIWSVMVTPFTPHPLLGGDQTESQLLSDAVSCSFNKQQQSVIFLLFAMQVAPLIPIKRGRRRWILKGHIQGPGRQGALLYAATEAESALVSDKPALGDCCSLGCSAVGRGAFWYCLNLGLGSL